MRFVLVLSGLSSASAQSASSQSSSQSSSLSSSALNTTSSSVATLTSSSSSVVLSSKSSSSSSVAATPLPSNATNSAVPSPKPTGYVNPWAGNFSGSLPQYGSGSAFAMQCQNAWYSSSSILDYMEGIISSRGYTTETVRSTTVYEVHTYYKTEYYTLCDGHARVITSAPSATSTTTLPPLTTTYLVDRIGLAKIPTPNCTISWSDCSDLWSRYSSATSVYNQVSFSSAHTVVSLGPGASYWVVDGVTTKFPQPSPNEISLGDEDITKYYKPSQYLIIDKPSPGGLVCACGKTMTAGGPPVTITNTISFTQTPYTPSCRTEQPTCTPGQQCQITGDSVEIFWFPPQTNATRDMCATAAPNPITSRPPTNFTWTPITTGPYTVLPGNTTWFSGNVYVSFQNVYGRCDWSGTSVEVGSTHHGNVLTMAPSELFSMRAHLTTYTREDISWAGPAYDPHGYSFDFADLVSPYPWSAWAGLDYCYLKSACTTMSGAYNPRIVVPEAIRRLDPRWATCDLGLYGLYDPPIALQSVGNMFATTTPPPAAPQPTPGQSPPQQNEPTNTPIAPGAPLPWQSDPAQPAPPNNDPVPGPPNPQNPSDPWRPINPGPNPAPGQNNPAPGQNNPAPGQNNPAPGQNNPAPGQNNPAPQPTTIGTIGPTPIVINPTNPAQITIGPSTLTPGAPAITVGPGTTISMQDPGHLIISTPGGAAPSTINVPRPIGPGPGSAPTPTAGVVITLPNGELITATAVVGEGHNGQTTATSVLISGTMISVGGAPITLANGMVLSEAPNGSGLVVVDPSASVTRTIPFSSVSGIYNPPTITAPPSALVTIGGRVYTATSSGGNVVILELGVTLSQGGTTVVDGTTVSNAGGSTGVVVGGSTARFPSTTGSGAGVFTGEGMRVARSGKAWMWCVGLMAGMAIVL